MPFACVSRFSASNVYVYPLPSCVILPAKSYAKPEVVIWCVLAFTVMLNVPEEHCVELIVVKFP
jgi:hypothetical protein